jgi:hypothetical protein
MNKKDVKKLYPDAYCEKKDNGRFYIYEGPSGQPIFPHGHVSSRKAWSDAWEVLDDDKLQFGV